VNSAQVAERFGLGETHAGWLAKLDAVASPDALTTPNETELTESLIRLDAAPDDIVDVVRTFPRPDRDPEAWWLLERSHHLLSHGLFNAGDSAVAVPALPDELSLFAAYVILVTLPEIRRCHEALGIPDDVSRETLGHLGRAMSAYRASHGTPGVEITWWEWMRFFGRLYQVGRLTTIPYRLCTQREAGPLFWYDADAMERLGPGFRKGDPALSLHIPATDPLTPAACDESLARMRTAFTRVYPGEPLRVATCTSWILDEQLAEYLLADSNIIAFQRRFELVPGARDEDETMLRFVFGADRPKELAALPQRTTLERAVVEHLRLGRHWRLRTGWVRP
jgi:hypothetical protein